MQYQNLKGFGEHVDNLASSLSATSGIVDLQPFFFQFTLATTTALIFGQPAGRLKGEELESFASNFDHASTICASRLRLGDFNWAYTPSSYTKACGIVKRFVHGFVQQALQVNKDDVVPEESNRYAFIHDLYDELKDTNLVRDQLVNVLIAGRDTTACLMSWTL